MSDPREITYEGKKITVRDWADGKVLLMSADDSVKENLLDVRKESPDYVELLTDPDMTPVPEDAEDVMPVIVDPKHVCLLIDFSGRNTGFFIV
ncbi:MAG: hypothetical protein IKP40_13560 [Clostridia bacterium]|nr:hypothetical protein [Clostridia bacterium]